MNSALWQVKLWDLLLQKCLHKPIQEEANTTSIPNDKWPICDDKYYVAIKFGLENMSKIEWNLYCSEVKTTPLINKPYFDFLTVFEIAVKESTVKFAAVRLDGENKFWYMASEVMRFIDAKRLA